MTGQDLMAQSGARWCEKHQRWECSADKPNHHATAIRGMAMCKNHVGRSTAMAKALGEANLLAWSAQAETEARPLDPGTVVLQQLRVAVMRADLYAELLRLQVVEEGGAGLVGLTFAAGRDGERVQTGERVRGLAGLEGEWRDRAVRFAKTAHDMGIAEREIRLQEGQAQWVVSAFLPVLEFVAAVDRDAAVQAFMDGLGIADTATGEVVA